MTIDNKDIVITSAVRTAIGTFKGSLKDMQASDLGALVTKTATKKSHLNSMELFDKVCGKSLTGQSGYFASKAIDSFINR